MSHFCFIFFFFWPVVYCMLVDESCLNGSDQQPIKIRRKKENRESIMGEKVDKYLWLQYYNWMKDIKKKKSCGRSLSVVTLSIKTTQKLPPPCFFAKKQTTTKKPTCKLWPCYVCFALIVLLLILYQQQQQKKSIRILGFSKGTVWFGCFLAC